jgi:hypothetical protein
MNSICSYHDDWHVWYRPGGSSITGTDHGEFFAHEFRPEHHIREEAACWRVVSLHAAGLIPWKDTGAWTHYRAMLDLPDDEVHGWHDGRHATLIDDWTDDFDMPLDYRTWYGRRAHCRYSVTINGHGPSDAAANVTTNGKWVPEDQLWCAVAHAVEHNRQVIPYCRQRPHAIHEPPIEKPEVIVTPMRGGWSGVDHIFGALS